MKEEDVNLDPDEAGEGGGGLLQAVADATLYWRAVGFDYNGSVAVPVPAIHIHGEYVDEEGNEATFEEYYSMGDASKLRPKEDGSGFRSLVEGGKPVKTCKGMQVIASLISANGGDKSIIASGNLLELDGIVCDMERKPDIERPGLANPNNRKRTIMLISAIKSPPGKAKGKAKAGPKPVPVGAKPAAAAAKPKANPLRQKTIESVVATLESNGGSVAHADLPQALFRKFRKDADIRAMTELAADEDFINANDTPWAFDGETVAVTE
jgi:hypothetical protein